MNTDYGWCDYCKNWEEVSVYRIPDHNPTRSFKEDLNPGQIKYTNRVLCENCKKKVEVS